MVTSGVTLSDVALSRGSLDRSALERRDPTVIGRLLADPATRVVDVRGDRIAVDQADLRFREPSSDDLARLGVFLGRDAGGAAYVSVINDAEDEPGSDWLSLRQAGPLLGDRDGGIFATALALANWHAAHTHCPRCGTATEVAQAGWIRVCPTDGSEHYPRTDPAVIMSVIDGDDRLLLGRGAHWPEGRFSVLAGFVEPGESFEAAVAREVAEEVGVAVHDVRYLGNQPWPFPSSVMIGFESRTSDVDLDLDPAEMAEARWVSRDEYRDLLGTKAIHAPAGISIAKRIIEGWLGQTIESVLVEQSDTQA